MTKISSILWGSSGKGLSGNTPDFYEKSTLLLDKLRNATSVCRVWFADIRTSEIFHHEEKWLSEKNDNLVFWKFFHDTPLEYSIVGTEWKCDNHDQKTMHNDKCNWGWRCKDWDSVYCSNWVLKIYIKNLTEDSIQYVF